MNPDFPRFDGFHLLGILMWGFASLIGLAILIAVVVLLVRYLLVATRAHQLYIANNTPSVAATTPVAPGEPLVAPKRTPKTPPAV